MGDELFLSPEITVHEEPGHITINNMDEVSVEIDDEEPLMADPHAFPFANGDIPPEISITKVQNKNRMGQPRGGGGAGPRPMLKVRNDLGFPPGAMAHSAMMQQQQQQQFRPPPLMKRGVAPGGLPPMPKLRFGGPRVQRPPSNPMQGMMNMHNQMQQRMPLRGAGMRSTRPMGAPRPPMMNTFGSGLRPVAGMSQVLNNGGQPFPFTSQGMTPQMAPPPGTVSRGYHNQGMPRTSSPSSLRMVRKSGPPGNPRGPPPMMRVGPGGAVRPAAPMGKPGKASANSSVHVRTVFVPPPMKMNNGQQHQRQMHGSNSARKTGPQFNRVQQHQQHHSNGALMALMERQQQQNQQVMADEEEEIDDEEEDSIIQQQQHQAMEEEELDDVEPDVDPNNEVDDVEPIAPTSIGNAMSEQEDLIRKIDQHQVTVSITPKSKQQVRASPLGPPVADVSITTTGGAASSLSPLPEPESSTTSVAAKLPQYVRNPNGKGFMRRILAEMHNKKKKKKKNFRGGNYRFDGSSIKKKRTGMKKQSTAFDEEETRESPVRETSFLEYLGIQRKDASDNQADNPSPTLDDAQFVKPQATAGQTAKKSFKPQAR